MNPNPKARVSLKDLGEEPFRILFPLAVLSGITGAALWPLHFAGLAKLYPGQAHARIMACGLLGGFIVGFLGTSMPRMLSAPPLGSTNVLVLAGLHLAMLISYATGNIGTGDHIFLALLLWFLVLLAKRFFRRRDIPPPGFSLVALALFCALSGAAIGVVEFYNPELDPSWVLLRRLLLYQGFILLPILGIGPFLLPRFFGLPTLHDFPEMRLPSPAWLRKAGFALAIGAAVIASLFIEASGWHRAAHLVRFAATLLYLGIEFPFRRVRRMGDALATSLWICCIVLLCGFLAIAIFPGYRVGLLHLALIGGFSVTAFVVATRVAYGHSGSLDQLRGRNWWLVIAVSLMLFATATRASADLWPSITVSHYIYGAIVWIAAALLWSWRVFPKLLEREP